MSQGVGPRRDWMQAGVVALLFVGYSGYYLCRSNLSVSMKAIEAELVNDGSLASEEQARKALGGVVSLGILAYAIGKFAAGGLADRFGGRWNFLQGMAWSVVFTVGFALSGTIPLFTLAWVGNRLAQSLGWVGAVKIASRWFSFRSYGTAMGLISLSYLFGNWASKQLLGWLFDQGLGWRQVFGVAAAVLAGLWALNFRLLREKPGNFGIPEPAASPANLFEFEREQSPSLARLWATLLRSPLFWMVCVLSIGLTFIREGLNTWTPTYLQEVAGSSRGLAARQSSWFDFWGGVSVLIAGFLGDALGRRGRALLIALGTFAAAWLLRDLGAAAGGRSAVLILTMIAFALLGPYSYLAGAVALDFGGKKGSATAAGLIDGIGYLIGGVLAGRGIAELQLRAGWDGAFRALAVVALSCGVVGLVYLALMAWQDRRRAGASK